MEKLNRKSSMPLYEQLKNVLVQQIKSGELKPQELIPSERELCETYNVSRITVRQAIDLTVNEGFLSRKHGKGTFVTGPTIKQELSKVSGFQSTLSRQGIIGKTEIIKSEKMETDIQLSKTLDIDVLSQIINLQLMGFGDESPLVFYDCYFPLEIGKEMILSAEKAIKRRKPFSIFDLYRENDIILPTHTEQTFESILSDERLTKLLKLEETTAIFKTTSVIYASEQPIEYRVAYYRGDKFNFYLTRPME
ncbi:GntR family transcriptional regulator [Virgibacillus ihumii]|uniref:GntR family transcriptional regulator n=1 Tax=Virgibacillus ihumii TaxID=2686091 RepID=UPI00157BD1BF|nr:GntR family transcriptional regulator [Virgibacillus ihumii]